MKTKKRWMTTVALVALLVPAVALAQPGPGWGRGGGPGQGGGMGPLWEKLDLTDAQQSRLQEMRTEHQQAMVRLRGQMAQARSELQALMMDPEVTKDDALRAQAKVSSLRTDAARLRLEHRFAVREVLTPEQRTKLAELRSQRPGRGGGPGWHRGDGPGHGGRGQCDGEGPHGPRGRFRD